MVSHTHHVKLTLYKFVQFVLHLHVVAEVSIVDCYTLLYAVKSYLLHCVWNLNTTAFRLLSILLKRSFRNYLMIVERLCTRILGNDLSNK